METRSGAKSEGDGHVGHRNKRYLLTLTLYQCASAFKRLGLKIPPREFFDEVERELVEMIGANFSGSPVNVEEIPFDDLCDEIVAMANQARQIHPDAVVLTTSPLIAYEAGGMCIHLNRMVNFNGDIIGIGPRPGHPSLDHQIRAAHDKPIIIIEDGAFSGSSLKFVLNCFPNENIVSIVLGIIFPKAKQLLESSYNGQLLYHVDSDDTDLVDWMPTHDFFPFVPNSGLVVGSQMGRNCFPYYLYNHASIAMPYILPYGLPDKWASLRGEREELAKFSASCIQLTRKIFGEMERLNNKPITIADIVCSNPRTSIPVSNGQNDFSELSESVLDVLSGDLQFLS
ncbi:MAG: hypothetical protein A2365_00820 [Candidatus Nealsonbacteria bacterium RIFOXYB1_FULL_40_15]|uniref:Uncharacterized protein n=2 Tax=Candidatus Nealsoniibacteriota TaxID=1817911 RepID=A0A1G2EQJ7_9BACT|nr:MAG: hypothetical protein A2365_00820 [Candidatus Nealsonbacteria bacterium RIFOXYB1_FULL_40_15]OGZ28064.1 MAG: hypothetical protein A2427_03300 [Candidatus Nealsonbacteria bacterium RIFOXYC1_FULL_40_7]OGZ28525.1 MAG: hypothetical protein A2562_03510 [Candidatus Nealsonbacteria bacterium RIFOXYD1_FULL_39_11]